MDRKTAVSVKLRVYQVGVLWGLLKLTVLAPIERL